MDANDWLEKGFALGNQNSPTKHQDALSAFENALSINPNLTTAWIYKGIALANLGRHQDSLDAFANALSIDPKLSMAWYYRGTALYSLGLLQDALDSYEKALSIDPKMESAWCNKGTVLVNSGKNEEALISIDKALSLYRNDSIAWNSKGIALLNLGKNEEALLSFENALLINPIYINAKNNKAATLAKLGKSDESRKICKKCHADLRFWNVNLYDLNDPQKSHEPVRIQIGTVCDKCSDVNPDVQTIVNLFKALDEKGDTKTISELQYIVDTLILNQITIPSDLFQIIAPLIRDQIFDQYDRESGGRYSKSFTKSHFKVIFYIRDGVLIWGLD